MVATPTLRQRLEAWGFRNPACGRAAWIRNCFVHAPRKTPREPRPIFIVPGAGGGETKNIEAFLKLELSGTQYVVGGGPDLEMLKRKYLGGAFHRLHDRRGAGASPRQRGCVRVSEPHRYLRTGVDRGICLRRAGGGVPGAGTDRHRHQRRDRVSERGPATSGDRRARSRTRCRREEAPGTPGRPAPDSFRPPGDPADGHDPKRPAEG